MLNIYKGIIVMRLRTVWKNRINICPSVKSHPLRSNFSRKLFLCLSPLLLSVLSACSRGDVPLPTLPVAETPVIPTEVEIAQTETPIINEKYPLQVEFAAVWGLDEEGLSMRNQAGISAPVVEVIPWNSHQIYLTGNRSLLGSSVWLEIMTENNIKGWVSAWNLTEYVSPNQFCDDSEARVVIEEFLHAVTDNTVPFPIKLISPNRGLSIRLNWYGPDVNYAMDEIDLIFTDGREMDWGVMADSGLQVAGSFEKIIQPKLEDVFTNSPDALCNELAWGSTSGIVLWPDELKNLNFYSFYRPAKEDGNPLDWRTWAIGIEYVNHQPYVAILVHYSSEL
jgi:hypothetical protein